MWIWAQFVWFAFTVLWPKIIIIREIYLKIVTQKISSVQKNNQHSNGFELKAEALEVNSLNQKTPTALLTPRFNLYSMQYNYSSKTQFCISIKMWNQAITISCPWFNCSHYAMLHAVYRVSCLYRLRIFFLVFFFFEKNEQCIHQVFNFCNKNGSAKRPQVIILFRSIGFNWIGRILILRSNSENGLPYYSSRRWWYCIL